MEQLPLAFYALIQVVFLFVHYPTTRRFLRILSFTCLLALLLYSYTKYSLRTPGEDYVLGCSNGILLLTAIHLTFLCPDFPNGFQWRDSAPGSTPNELPLAQKLSWMAELASNMRRIGVTRGGGAMNSPVVARNLSARDRFVISRVILSILSLAVFHFTVLYRLKSPSFNPALHQDAHDGRFIRAHSSVFRRFLEVLVWAAGTASEMTFLQGVGAVLSVGAGASQPEEWPTMFGSPVHAYSVRRFWS